MSSSSKATNTVPFCCSTAGEYLAPFVVYKGLNLYDTWTVGGPPECLYGVTPSGWMQDLVFESWLIKFCNCNKSREKLVF